VARIVYVGSLFEGSSAAFRAESLRRLGHDVVALEGYPPEPAVARIRGGLRRRLGVGGAHRINEVIVEAVKAQASDVLWVDKGLNVTRDALVAVREARPAVIAVHYSLDDYRIPGNTSRDMREALPAYDLVVTTKSFNLEWLRERRVRRPFMSWQGFDETVHTPPGPGERDASLEGRIVMVGAWERERAEIVEALAAAGLPVTVLSVWKQWASAVRACPSVDWRRWQTYGRAYSVAIGSAAIALGVLRKQASDLHTQRSVEIPACGTALLAERTVEHEALFLDGVEAEFFGTPSECVEKARTLLRDPDRRARLARAGRERCLRGGYSWTDRVRQILAEIGVRDAGGDGAVVS
jgi:spore maturation protein CgeB